MPTTKATDVEGSKEIMVEKSSEATELPNKSAISDAPCESEPNVSEKTVQPISEAAVLLAKGKRHLYVKDFPSAVVALGDACSKYSELYGDLGDECADPYFNYGCALLELAKEESGVLDVDNKDKDSEKSEDDDEDEEESVDEVKDEDKNKTEEKINEKKKDEDQTEAEVKRGDEDIKTDAKDNENKTNEDQTENNGLSTEEKNCEGDVDPSEEEEEDVNNLQLAWEMFELAKRSFLKQHDFKKLAETYLKLAEVALESENYEVAIIDTQRCLEIQKEKLPPVSREIAETYFQLGIACSLSNQFDEAIKHFTSAGELLEDRLQKLHDMNDPEPENLKKNPFYTIKGEIDEIKSILPEIKEKLDDMEEFKKETMKVVNETFGGSSKVTSVDGGTSSNGVSSTSTAAAPANDISHLIRKKRKSDDSIQNESKKTKY